MGLNLCPDLQLVYDYEVAHGNAVIRIDSPAGIECEYAVVFSEPLKICGTPQTDELPSFVMHWESHDSHYPTEAGFFCSEHRHSVAGPVLD